MGYQGNPCWYELNAPDLDAAGGFYGRVFGWQVVDSGMEGFDYRLARAGEAMVAGMMAQADQPPRWLIYFAVDDCDRMAEAIRAAGGSLCQPPTDIPGTGRYAVATDPQGVGFGILQPDMSAMSAEEIARAALAAPFDQDRPGHGQWNELMSPDPVAGFAFYSGLFGWTKGEAMPMGAMGDYQLFRHEGRDIGAMMGLGDSPEPLWLPYFGVDDAVTNVARTVEAEGGKIHHGPVEVPGPAYIAVAQDPQGAWFAVVGAEE